MTRLSVLNPATEQPIVELDEAGVEEADEAVARAKAAFPAWRDVAPAARAALLRKVATLVEENAEELARIESENVGKPISGARAEVGMVANVFHFYSGAVEKHYGDTIPVAGGVDMTFREPLGVVGLIVPWNFPLNIASWKLGPALACGNTVVLKPAELTPLSALRLKELMNEAGIPDGVVNVLVGKGSVVGQRLVEHPEVAKIGFTGSTEVGREVMKGAAGTIKRVTLELGGKSANVIFEDAALDQAVEGIVNGIFFNQGHVCCAGSRLLIQESVADVVIGKLWERMGRLRLGDPLDKNTDVGAINSREQLTRIQELVSAGEEEGALRRSVACELPERGWWFAPTIFTEVAPAHRIAVEEIFGPVVSVLTFRTQAEAIEKANNSRYGLAAGIWTDKGSKAFEVAAALQAGVVWQNTYNKFDPTSPM